MRRFPLVLALCAQASVAQSPSSPPEDFPPPPPPPEDQPLEPAPLDEDRPLVPPPPIDPPAAPQRHHPGRHHHPWDPTARDEAVPATPQEDPQAVMQRAHAMAERMTGPAGMSRARRTSGTSWLPDSAPMRGFFFPIWKGGVMAHGNIFTGYDMFTSSRGDGSFFSTNDFGAMAWLPLGPTELLAKVMISAEPFTVSPDGYPLIFQTGETAHGETLHDRQHPHDLFMELALDYTIMFTKGFGAELYVAAAGEPALGPTAYKHRPSAASDPLAPIGHHWLDSTHISYGVVTAGLFSKHFKLEGSWFNGREPDEVRYDLDLRVPDSYAGRATVNLGERVSLQASYGFLKSPEAHDPTNSIHRLTTSAIYNHRLSNGGNLAITFAFGENIPLYGRATHTLLHESSWDMDQHHTIFTRIEYGMRTGADLSVAGDNENLAFHLAMFNAGYVHYFGPWGGVSPGLGFRGAIGVTGADLGASYGTQVPVGGAIFVHFRPVAMPGHDDLPRPTERVHEAHGAKPVVPPPPPGDRPMM